MMPTDLLLVADVFDARDLVYRSLITPLPPECKPRNWPEPESQEKQSCVGHALANLIEVISLRAKERWRRSPGLNVVAPAERERPSAEMLYKLALRYDEELGENGTSLRAALKGWYHHGVALRIKWRESLDDLDDQEFRKHCLERPLGAYYRVNHRQLDDVQSAICETGAVVAALKVPGSWVATDKPLNPTDWNTANNLHAVALIGYDRDGFIGLNSYGAEWGEKGTGRIPYASWLKHAVDAWVARVGVPGTIGYDDLTRSGRSTLNGPAAQRAPSQENLRLHVVNLGYDGGLSTQGRYVTSDGSLAKILDVAAKDETTNNILVWFHDSMIEDDEQRWIAEERLALWKDNRIYPIYVCWTSRFVRQALEDVAWRIERELPMAGIQSDMRDQVDRLSERLIRRLAVTWTELLSLPAKEGANCFLGRLNKGLERQKKKVHLVAAGNGCSYLLALVDRPGARRPASISLLAPTCSVQELENKIPGGTSVLLYTLRDGADETAGHEVNRIRIHSRSFLSLVARGLAQDPTKRELDSWNRIEYPIAGLERYSKSDRWAPRLVPSEHSRARSPLELSTDLDTWRAIAHDICGNSLMEEGFSSWPGRSRKAIE